MIYLSPFLQGVSSSFARAFSESKGFAHTHSVTSVFGFLSSVVFIILPPYLKIIYPLAGRNGRKKFSKGNKLTERVMVLPAKETKKTGYPLR